MWRTCSGSLLRSWHSKMTNNWPNSPASPCSHIFKRVGSWWTETGWKVRTNTGPLVHKPRFSSVFPIFLTGITFSATSSHHPMARWYETKRLNHFKLLRRKSFYVTIFVMCFRGALWLKECVWSLHQVGGEISRLNVSDSLGITESSGKLYFIKEMFRLKKACIGLFSVHRSREKGG